MFWKKRSEPSLLPSKSADARPTNTVIDTQIVQDKYLEEATYTRQEKIQTTKSMPTPSLTQIVERKTWEHGQLRKKLLCLQEKYGAALRLYEVVANVATALEEALLDFDNLNIDTADDATGELFVPLTKVTDIPIAPTAVGVEIGGNHGSTMAIGVNRDRIQASNRMPTHDLPQMIAERTRQNILLEQELAYREKKHRAVKYLYGEMSLVVDVLKEGLHNFKSLNMGTGDDAKTPPIPTAVDIEIARSHGSTMAIEASREWIQASKRMPTPNLSDMIKERTSQIIQLERELACLEEKYGAAEYLYQEVTLVLTSLQRALLKSCKLSTNTKEDEEGYST